MLHGAHVLIGTIFIAVQYIRIANYHMTNTHHLGLELSILYWHFVDVVWLFLFCVVYYWGGSIITNLNSSTITSEPINLSSIEEVLNLYPISLKFILPLILLILIVFILSRKTIKSYILTYLSSISIIIMKNQLYKTWKYVLSYGWSILLTIKIFIFNHYFLFINVGFLIFISKYINYVFKGLYFFIFMLKIIFSFSGYLTYPDLDLPNYLDFSNINNTNTLFKGTEELPIVFEGDGAIIIPNGNNTCDIIITDINPLIDFILNDSESINENQDQDQDQIIPTRTPIIDDDPNKEYDLDDFDFILPGEEYR